MRACYRVELLWTIIIYWWWWDVLSPAACSSSIQRTINHGQNGLRCSGELRKWWSNQISVQLLTRWLAWPGHTEALHTVHKRVCNTLNTTFLRMLSNFTTLLSNGLHFWRLFAVLATVHWLDVENNRVMMAVWKMMKLRIEYNRRGRNRIVE